MKRNFYQQEDLTKRLLEEYNDYLNKLNESHNYCRCKHPVIRCDNRGCHCQMCGGSEKRIEDMDYVTYIELRLATQERKTTVLQTKLDEIKIVYEEAKDSPNKESIIPTQVWQLLQKLGDLFGDKS